jgi:hypothetical protein
VSMRHGEGNDCRRRMQLPGPTHLNHILAARASTRTAHADAVDAERIRVACAQRARVVSLVQRHRRSCTATDEERWTAEERNSSGRIGRSQIRRRGGYTEPARQWAGELRATRQNHAQSVGCELRGLFWLGLLVLRRAVAHLIVRIHHECTAKLRAVQGELTQATQCLP